jgi:ribulose-bisphosphate carboxylase small chain
MRFETFAFLPPLSAQQIEAQILHALQKGWLLRLEYTENPSSADLYWENWPIPASRINSATNQPEPLTAGYITAQLEACARRHPYAFVRVHAFNRQSQHTEMSFITRTPQEGQ